MSWPDPSLKAYTDTPDLHPNLILGSLQLLFWLFYHPSAWRNHVARLDPTLRPDFALSELRREQWRNPALRRLLLLGYVVLPLLIGLLIGLLPWWLIDVSGQEIVGNILISLAYGLAGAMAVGVTVSVAVGVAFSAMISLAAGLIPVAIGKAMAAGIIEVTTSGKPEEVTEMVRVILFGLTAGIASSVAVSVAKQKQSYTWVRRAGGFVGGIVISGLLLGAAFIVANGAPLGLPPGRVGSQQGLAGGTIHGLAGGLLFGLLYSLAIRVRTHHWRFGLVLGLLNGLSGGLAYGLTVGISSKLWLYPLAIGLGGGLLFGGLFALPYLLAERIAGAWAGAVAGALVSGLGWAPLADFILKEPIDIRLSLSLTLLATLLGLTRSWWRPVVLYPILTFWNFLLFRADERRAGRRPSLLRLHSAFWDEHQRLPLYGLDDHLVLVAERNPAEGRAALDYVAAGRQRGAAQAAEIELEARRLESCRAVEAIGQAHQRLGAGELAGPASALLRSFSRISQDAQAALNQESTFNQRLALSAVEDRLDGLLRELTRSSERYAVRFRPIAARWRRIVADQARQLAAAVEQRQEIDSPYVIGVPLTGQQEIFVGRTDVSARIEQLLRDRRRPPLLLYGQRRMGKTSLLNNLGRLLPSTILPLFVDLQGPASQANSHGGFLYNLARGMINSARRQRDLALPPLSREALAVDPFTGFDEWLDEVEQVLGEQTALLALDEFESLEAPISEGRFSEAAIMGMFRHLIQHRPHFKVLLTGSHSLDEFKRWASYLINVQIVHLGYLSESEARQLIQRPVQGFALRYEPEACRRVLYLSRGHPFLVQLLCAEIVALKNEQDPAVRRLARLADVEAAVPMALDHGSFFFADIERNQLNETALALLRFIAAQGEGTGVDRASLAAHYPDALDPLLALLTRRELIEVDNSGCRFQVELIRRWFAR